MTSLPIGLRLCRDCGFTGPLALFAKHSTSRYGRQNLCLPCFGVRAKRYAAARRTRVGTHVLNVTASSRWARLKQQARDRGIIVQMTRAEWEAVVVAPCHYCGGALAPTGYGLDRKDTHGPYSVANVVPCCQSCNRRKKNSSYEVALKRLGRSI